VCQQQNLKRIAFFYDETFEELGYLSKGKYQAPLQSALPEIEITFETEKTIQHYLDSNKKDFVLFNLMPIDYMRKYLELFNNIQQSGAPVVSGLEANLLSNKKWMARLHDEKNFFLFTDQEIEAIQESLAYTFDLHDENRTTALEQKDKYIFKVTNSMGGDRVFIGAELSHENLERELDLASEWVVQELKDVVSIEMPVAGLPGLHKHKFVLGLFNSGNECCGLDVRLSRNSKIINVTSGAISSFAFPTSPEKKQCFTNNSILERF
jgi:hypothetical protein